MAGRGNRELIPFVKGGTLNANNPTRFSREFQLGEPWNILWLHFHLDVTIGSGSGAISEGELKIIKAITLKTDRNELICDNVPGRFLYRLAQIKSRTAPMRDAVAASTDIFDVLLPIYFLDPLALRPQDYVLDTRRYSSIELTVQMGGIADLLSTVGTATVTQTIDIYVDRERGRLPDEVKPTFYKQYGHRAPVNPSNSQEIDLERAASLSYQRLGLLTASAATAGVPFHGTASNAVLDDVTLDDGLTPYEAVKEEGLREINKVDYELETVLTGWYWIDLLRMNGSLNAGIYSGDRSRLKVKWTNDASLPSNPQATLGYEAIRPLN